MAEPHPFRRAAEAKDLELLTETLREDVVLHSPILFRGFEGRDTVATVLTHVAATLEDLTYTDELQRRQDRRASASRPRSPAPTASWRASTSSSSTRTAASPS